MRPLFQRYPKVISRVPFEALVDLPTPVTEHRGIWVKRDDRIGGGAMRKLEFFHPKEPLLAIGSGESPWLRALARHRRVRILPWGLRMLADLPRILGGTVTLAPAGGSDPVTTLGFVNAAFELVDQIAQGECPRPDAVFVPLGTGSTAAGLALGLGLAGMDVPLHAVRIKSRWTANLRNVYGLASQAACLLDEGPRLGRVILERGFRNPSDAREFFRPIELDEHSSKAAACVLARRSGYRSPLLWLTYGAMEASTRRPVP